MFKAISKLAKTTQNWSLPALVGRDPRADVRTATPLELLFDLVSVIGIANAVTGLHHGIAAGDSATSIIQFLMAFFSIWLAWIHYTWFASAFDNSSVLFRIATMCIMVGSLIMATGIHQLFKHTSFALVVFGYVIMRLVLSLMWFWAAKDNPEYRTGALLYGFGIVLTQWYWIGFYLVDASSQLLIYCLFFVGVILELSVPAIAERITATPWHAEHIIERYGLLNIIVLGETFLACAMAIQELVDDLQQFVDLALLAISALCVVFALWWLYFNKQEHLETLNPGCYHRSIIWAYGHYFIFMAGSAVGAGYAVLVDELAQAQQNQTINQYAIVLIAVCVATYMFGLWFVRDRFALHDISQWVLPVFGSLILLTPFMPFSLALLTLFTLISVPVREYLVKRMRAA